MATTPTTLTSSIDDAVKTEETKLPVGDKQPEPKVDDKKADDKPANDDKKDDKVSKYGLSALEEEQALQLFHALKDPKQAPGVIEFMAKEAGLLNKPIKTEAQADKAAETLHSLLKESLGPEFEYLADKMAPALDKYVDGKLKETTKAMENHLQKAEEAKLADASSRAMSAIAKDFFAADVIPDDVTTEMSKLMDKMPPSADMTPKEYIQVIFNSVVGQKGLTKVDPKKNERVDKNRSDAPSRLASNRSAEPVTATQGKAMTLDEAVRAAAETSKE